MSETTSVPESTPEAAQRAAEPPAEPTGNPLVESILDNLPVWAFVALAISALYLVWATLVIVEKYVDVLPSFAP